MQNYQYLKSKENNLFFILMTTKSDKKFHSAKLSLEFIHNELDGLSYS